MDLGLKGKKALVFGGSKGIGRGIAEALIAEGADVAIAARDAGRLAQTAKQIGAAAYFACDLSVAGESKKLVQSAIREFGGLDILVTNTGGPARGTFTEITDAQWDKDFQSVWMSVVEAFQTALPHMAEKKFGRILMVTSLAGKEPIPKLTTSNGFRAGLAGLAKSVANEYAALNVTVNVLMPGMINTDRLKDLKLTDEWVRNTIPAQRLGEPRDMGYLAAFLASPLASYITGQSIAVDGGHRKGY